MSKEKAFDESILDIDLTRLDEEWINQPRLFFKYASMFAKITRKEQDAKAERELIKSEIASRMRKNPTKYGLDKATEASINSAMMKQSKYREAQNTLLNLRYDMGVIQAAVRSLDHRKSALERLVSLHGQNYFSTPTARDPNSKEAVDDIEKKAARTKKKKRNKR